MKVNARMMLLTRRTAIKGMLFNFSCRECTGISHGIKLFELLT